MFTNKKIQDLQNEIRNLKAELDLAKLGAIDSNKNLNIYKEKFDKREREIASERKIAENELAMKISQAVQEEKNKNIELEKSLSTAESKNEILEKAFENMGFDVKDMKEIMNKLVEAIVAKSQINLLKS